MKTVKEKARQAFSDQQSQDNEGGAPCFMSFVAGYVDAHKSLEQQVIDYETDWVKMRKYYDGAREKMKMLDEAIEVIGFYADHGTYTQSNMRNDSSNVFICDSGPFKIMGKRAREFLEKIRCN